MRHRHRPRPLWVRWLFVAAGAFMAAAGLELFLIPNSMIDGGVTGLSILAAHVTTLPVGLFLVLLNLPFLYVGYAQVGRTFAVTTGLGVLLMAAFATLLAGAGPLTRDPLLVAVFGGIVVGAGVGTVLRYGGSLDGSEVIALGASRATGFTVGEVVLAINVLIFAGAGFILGWDRALYSLLAYMAAFKTIDLAVQGLDESRGVFIISQKAQDLSEAIQARLGRGVTHLEGAGGYSSASVEVLYTVVTRLELAKLKSIVEEHDDEAFFAIHPVAEVIGGRLRKHRIH